MSTLDTFTCTDNWSLVYDSAASGDFAGTIQELTGSRSLCYIGSGIPVNDNAGFVFSGGFLQITVNAANKLYAKRYPGDPYSMPKLSLAITNMSVVGGAAAVGEAPTANPIGISAVDLDNLKRAILADALGRLVVTNSADIATSATTLNLNDAVTVAVTADIKSWGALIGGAFTGSVLFQVSTDGGATYGGTVVQSWGSSSSSGYVTGATTPGGPYSAPVQPGVTHVRAVCSALSSGNPVVIVFTSAKPITAFGPGITGLGGGNNRVGYVVSAAVWTRESTTPVNATLGITGAAKTTFNTTSGTALNTATSYGDKFAAAAGADVAGTLIIEASPDTGTTWYPVTSVALAQVGATGNYGAYIETPCCEATMRGRLLNGASNQTRAYLTTRMIG